MQLLMPIILRKLFLNNVFVAILAKSIILLAILSTGIDAVAQRYKRSKEAALIPAIDYQSLISKADLIYNKPVKLSQAGQPIGNGRMGSLIWTTPQSLNLQVNRVDIFNIDSNSNTFNGNPPDYCGGAGIVSVDFQSHEAVFDDNTFNQHLSCYDGTIETSGKGIKTNAFVWNKEDVMAIKVTDFRSFQTPALITLRALRPSQTIQGKYSAISKLEIIGDKILLIQEFTEDKFFCKSAVALTIPDRKVKAGIAKDTEVKLSALVGSKDYTILISSAATFDRNVDVVAQAIKKLNAATSKGFDKMLASNKAWWHSFWKQSYIQLHSKDGVADYVSENYAYYLYLMASASRGEYMVKFNGMLWTTDGDSRSWGSPYWGANQSCLYNALLTANKIELLNPMFKTYTRMYETCAIAAKQQWRSKGIYIPETVGFDGPVILPDSIASEMSDLFLLNKPWEQRSNAFKNYAVNKNPHLSRWNSVTGYAPFGYVTHIFSRGAKIAYLYWMNYEYTQDKEWLEKFAYPMVKGIAEFYRNFPNMKRASDGKYHIYHVNDNEPVWNGHNTDEEISAMMGILPVAIKASEILNLDADLRPLWKELLQNLSPLPLSSDFPKLNGKPVTFVKSLLPVRNGDASGLPDLNTMPLWCFDLCTMESKDKEMMKVANNTFDAFFPLGINEATPAGTLTMLPAVGALLGRKDATRYLITNQMKALNEKVLENRMDDLEGNQATTAERLGRSSEALQNALCQSIPPNPGEDAIIRVFPAWPEEWDAQFQLLCRGNFLVSSSYRKGEVEYIRVKSQGGKECRIRNPWGDSEIDIYENGGKIKLPGGALISFQTKINGQYTIVRKGYSLVVSE